MRSVQLFVPGLVPDQHDPNLALSASFPSLQRLLSRANVSATGCESEQAWLCTRFGIVRQGDWPVAALTLTADGGAPGEQHWLRADPVHLRPDQGVLVLVDSWRLRIEPQEAAAFIASLNAHFALDGLQFMAPCPTRWYVQAPRPVALRTWSPAEAEGRSVDPLLPAGPDALAWHRWFNEAQMLLHAHPMNEARESRDELAVNSLWFWGAGRLPQPCADDLAHVWSDDVLLRGLAMSARLPWGPLPRDAATWLVHAGAGEHLILLPHLARAVTHDSRLATLAELERRWFAPLLAGLANRALGTVVLTTLHRGQALACRVNAIDLWKFWRRHLSLPVHNGEAEHA